MSKVDMYAQGRASGLQLALEIVKDGGIEALEKELKFRNTSGINLPLARKELDAACDKIKQRTCATIGLLSIATLHDEFDFGEKRAKRFWKRFESKAECISENMATWDDYQKMVKEELGLEIKIFDDK